MDDPIHIDKTPNTQEEFGIKSQVNNVEKPDVFAQILAGVMPPYMPPINTFSRINDRLFTCQECKDQFVLESSYNYHINRRSVLIRLVCPFCLQNFEFYNRCRLLEHFRCVHPGVVIRHLSPQVVTLNPLPVDWVVKEFSDEETFISTISLSSSIFTSTPAISSTPISLKPAINSPSSQNTPSSTYVPSSSNGETPMETNESKIETGLTFPPGSSCHECGNRVIKMDSHYLGTNQPPTLDYLTCDECSIPFPTQCALSAHRRTHSTKRPFICPECTRKYNNWSAFLYHLKHECFHFAKSVGFCCIACNEIFKTMVTLEVHLLKAHMKSVFKCNACPIACFTMEALEEHKIKFHRMSAGHVNSYQQCQICPDRLIPKAQFLFHINSHCKDNKSRVYVYHCTTCKFLSRNKSEYASHGPCEGMRVDNTDTPPFAPKLEENKQELSKCVVCEKRLLYSVPPPEKQRFIPRCNQCIKETSVVIKKRNGKDILFLKKLSDPGGKLIRLPKQEQEILTKAFDKTTQSNTQKYYHCHLCKAQLAMEWKTIQTHFSTKHPENNILLVTGFNGTHQKTLTTSSKLKVATTSNTARKTKTFLTTRTLKEVDFKDEKKPLISKIISPNTIASKSPIAKPTVNRRQSNLSSKKRRKPLSDRPSPEKEHFSSGQIINSSKYDNCKSNETKKNYVCAKCGFSEKGLKAFREHAMKHQDSSSPYPCLECGTCFVVKPSFAKHLHVAHRVRDVDAYMKEHKMKDLGEEEEQGPPVTKNQCRVCREHMPSEEALTKHMRVHGMAFLRMRSARRAPVSPP